MSDILNDILTLSQYDATSKIIQREQRELLLARMYYAGYQPVSLTDRQRDLVEINPDNPYRINICRTIVNTLSDELAITAFETAEADDKNPVEQFANRFYAANKINIVQAGLYNTSLSEREAYILLDWNDSEKIPSMYIHYGYTSTSVNAWERTTYGVTSELQERGNGDGMGVYIKYVNDDPSQGAEYAIQYWYRDELINNRARKTHRRTIYYPDRIVREHYDNFAWREYEPAQAWIMPDGSPIGVPAVAYYNKNDKSEFWDVMSLQDMVNKTLADCQASMDFYGFRVMIISGAYATTNGQPPNDSKSNVMSLQPGAIVGFGDRPAGDVSVDAIAGEDPSPLVNLLKDLIMFAAQITGTPTTKFTATAQVASAETLKEQKDSLNQRAKIMRGIYGEAWTQVMRLAVRINNAFGGEALDETVGIVPVWHERIDMDDLRAERELGASQSAILARLGYSQDKIDAMQLELSNRLKFANDFLTAYNLAAQSGISLADFAKFVGLSDEDARLLVPSESIPADDI